MPKVFSCFSGGGGSSLGYKASGFNVLGGIECDPFMSYHYKLNLNPKYFFEIPIQKFHKQSIPKELYNIDILDGSPPCSLFSLINIHRKENIGKEKKYKEGSIVQKIDELFFDFLEVAKILNPKVIVAENVVNILSHKIHMNRIIKKFKYLGYYLNIYKLDSSLMGIPQKRKRIFFIASKKNRKINFKFNSKLKLVESLDTTCGLPLYEKARIRWNFVRPGTSFGSFTKSHYFANSKLHPKGVCPTVTTCAIEFITHWKFPNYMTINFIREASTFPKSYKFKDGLKDIKKSYIYGMSVPPMMMKKISKELITLL